MKKRSPKIFKFTPRENQMAALIAKGLSRKIIADKMTIDINTVDVHLKGIKRKVGVETLYASGCVLSHYY